MDVDTDKSPIIVTACCILHNMCEDLRIPMPPADPEDDHHRILFPQPQREENIELKIGEVLRFEPQSKTFWQKRNLCVSLLCNCLYFTKL